MTSDSNSQDSHATKSISFSTRRSLSVLGTSNSVLGEYSAAAANHNYPHQYDTTNDNSNNFFHNPPPDRQDVMSSRRRLIAAGRVDASSAMHRLRTSMVGRTSVSDIWDDQQSSSRRISFSTDDGIKGTVEVPTPLSPPSTDDHPRFSRDRNIFSSHYLSHAFGQIPAIALIGIFHLMIGIPFGVSYFPMYWNSHPGENGPTEGESGGDLQEGDFPIPGKEALGIRMFLFATLVGQVIFTFYSGFPNPIGLQMVENIGFTKALSAVAISHQGYGLEALATVMLMFALASVLVGVVFYVLGKFQWGRVVYFFPTHVLIGLIGGIGVLIAKTGIEVTIAATLTPGSLVQQWKLWIVVAGLELFLRFLEYVMTDANGKPRFSLLSPVFFCMITPLFYFALWIFHIPISEANDAGYFFPSLENSSENTSLSSDSGFGTPWDIWKVIDFSKVSWTAIVDSLPTMVALVLFSLIHVPINIPAFALSTKVDVDMNQELVAHGFSNVLAGACGGLQNYMAYTQSVVYHKSGGTGRVSGIAVAIVTAVLFFVGPTVATYMPRCMAGTLLLHVGIDLFLEGVWDSFGKFDSLEYSGIWLIVMVMTLYGMEAAMVAGGVAAVSTYAVQSVAYLSPIRGVMPATTLRSSHWNRSHSANAILDDPDEGRSRILVVQLQGHLFFGNMANFTEQIHNLLMTRSSQKGTSLGGIGTIPESETLPPRVLILDCSLVISIDSSAAQAIVKLRDIILNQYDVQMCIFVTGSSEGFPTEYNLTDQLSSGSPTKGTENATDMHPNEDTALIAKCIQDCEEQKAYEFTGSRVSDSLDQALMEAENVMICRQNPSLVDEENNLFPPPLKIHGGNLSLEEEREQCVAIMKNICPASMDDSDANTLCSLFEREVYMQNDFVWKQNDPSDSVKLLITGQLIAELENEAGTTEIIPKRSIIGELGLVNGNPRMNSVRCTSSKAVLYSMSRAKFDKLVDHHPHIARHLDLICIKYLALRVQHVSNRIFETRCLPI